MSAAANLPPLIDRFWSRVDKSGGPDACWIWTGSLQNMGYGLVHISKTPLVRRLAHRVSFEISVRALAIGECVLHSCDNPPCVNPLHLVAGTQADNVADMIAKGRRGSNAPRGERASKAKLSEEKVLAIRALRSEGHTVRYLARTFGVCSSNIQCIVTGLSWKHVPLALAAEVPE